MQAHCGQELIEPTTSLQDVQAPGFSGEPGESLLRLLFGVLVSEGAQVCLARLPPGPSTGSGNIHNHFATAPAALEFSSDSGAKEA